MSECALDEEIILSSTSRGHKKRTELFARRSESNAIEGREKFAIARSTSRGSFHWKRSVHGWKSSTETGHRQADQTSHSRSVCDQVPVIEKEIRIDHYLTKSCSLKKVALAIDGRLRMMETVRRNAQEDLFKC